MIKGFRQIAALTAISRVLGFARDSVYAIVFGPGTLLDAWFIAFRIPNLSRRLFGEGAASASFIPVYAEQLHKDSAAAERLANTVITTLFVLLAGIVLLGECLIWLMYRYFGANDETRLILSLTAVTLPYMIFICLVAVIAGVLNVHKHFAAPAAAPIIMNLCIIAGSLAAAWLFPVHTQAAAAAASQKIIFSFSEPTVKQLFVVAVSVLMAGVLELLVQLRPLRKTGLSLRMAWEIYSDPYKRILRLMGPMIVGLAVTQINTLLDDLVAWWFSGSPAKGQFFTLLGHQIKYPLWRGSVSYLAFAQHLYQLPLGVFGISLATALFPVMSAQAAKKDYQGLCKTVSLGVRGAIFIAVPCSLGLVLIARPFISVWLQHGNFQAKDTPAVAAALAFYSVGITGYFMQHILVRAFYSLQDSRSPVRTGVIAVAANFLLNLTLIWPLGAGGLAASTAACSYLQVAILIVLLRRRLGHSVLEALGAAILKTAFASACMLAAAGAAFWLTRAWPDLFKLLTVIPVSAATFLLIAKLLRIEMLSLFTGGKQPANSTDLS